MSPSVLQPKRDPRTLKPRLCFHADTQKRVRHVPVTDLNDNTAVNIRHSGAQPLCTHCLAAALKYYPEH